MASKSKRKQANTSSSEFEGELRSATTIAYKKAVADGTFVSAVQSKFDRLIERITTEDITTVSLLLSRKGMELVSHCLENTNKLKVKSEDGYTLADTIASYAPTEAIKLLLGSAFSSTKNSDAIKKIIAETHELDGGIEVETFVLAIATLRERNEDTTKYEEIAKEIKSLYQIVD